MVHSFASEKYTLQEISNGMARRFSARCCAFFRTDGKQMETLHSFFVADYQRVYLEAYLTLLCS